MTATSRWREVDGVFLLDKGRGITSNAALQQARLIFRARKAGHTGSLDPLATGLLPLCFGEATKFAGHLLDSPKAYEVVVKLGERTCTGDAEGEVTESRPVPELDPVALGDVLRSFRGEQWQVPPMYSALKHGGRRLYELARAGEEVERPPRRIYIHDLGLLELQADLLRLTVGCSKGTYVRTLAEDIATRLGTVGHVAELRRTEVGCFQLGSAHRIEDLQARLESLGELALDDWLLPVDAALVGEPALKLDPEPAHRLRQGNPVIAAGPPGARVRLLDPSGAFMGTGRMDALGRQVAPERLLAARQGGVG